MRAPYHHRTGLEQPTVLGPAHALLGTDLQRREHQPRRQRPTCRQDQCVRATLYHHPQPERAFPSFDFKSHAFSGPSACELTAQKRKDATLRLLPTQRQAELVFICPPKIEQGP